MSLTLTGAISGLLRRGSPVRVDYGLGVIDGVYVGPDDAPDDRRNGPHTVAPVDEWPDDFNGSAAMARSCKDAEVTLDLTDPTGLLHALLWLEERGHDLWWARKHEHAAEIVAWSVVSVGRGGPVLAGIVSGYTDLDGVACVLLDRGGCIGGWSKRRDGWHARLSSKAIGVYPSRNDAMNAFDLAAFAAGYALTGEDGALTLPPLPEPA